MLIKSKESKMHKGKSFVMNEGIGGNGNTIILISSIHEDRPFMYMHTETFKNPKEAESWWKHSCN